MITIIELIKNTFNDNNITEKTTPNDVDEWDSLGHIMLIQTIEEKFKISFEIEELLEFDSVKDIINAINNKIT